MSAPPLARLRVWDDTLPRSGSLHMALDEALLRTSPGPLLRRYRWAEPTVTFGCFVPLADVRATFPGNQWQLVRRWTGGGIVPHREDATYSLVVPTGDPFCSLSTAASYAAVHAALAAALREAGHDVSLVTSAPAGAGGLCFQQPVTADVMLGGSKISGAAQRRSRPGLLHQGTLRGAPWPEAFPSRLAAEATMWEPEATLFAAAESLVATRYGTHEWLHRR